MGLSISQLALVDQPALFICAKCLLEQRPVKPRAYGTILMSQPEFPPLAPLLQWATDLPLEPCCTLFVCTTYRVLIIPIGSSYLMREVRTEGPEVKRESQGFDKMKGVE